jgi:hypothetical protein
VDFLAINERTGELSWCKPGNIYYVDDHSLYNQLPNSLQDELQPHFTKSENNQFGKIAQLIGKKIRSNIESNLLEMDEVENAPRINLTTLLKREFIGCLSLLDNWLEEQLTFVELEALAKVDVCLLERILVEASIGGHTAATVNVQYFVDVDELSTLFLLKSAKETERFPNYLGQAVGEVFRLALQREGILDWHVLQSSLTNYFGIADKQDYLQRMQIRLERQEEISNDILHYGIAPKDRFWQAVRLASGLMPIEQITGRETSLQTYLQGINLTLYLQEQLENKFNYKTLEQHSNYKIFKQLFTEATIDLDEFIMHLGSKIDFNSLHRKEWQKLVNRFEPAFNTWLYQYLQSKKLDAKMNYLAQLDEYRKLPILLSNGSFLNELEVQFETKLKNTFEGVPELGLLSSLKLISPDWLKHQYVESERLLKKQLKVDDAQLLPLFLDLPHHRSLIYFNEVDDAKKAFLKWIIEHRRETQQEQRRTAGGNLLEAFRNYDSIFGGQSSVGAIAIASGASSGGGHGSSNRTSGEAKNYGNTLLGRIAEHRVFMWLREQYKDNVKWVSRNAVDVGSEHPGYNQEGGDSSGCDIQYKDENGQEFWVEVKGKKSDDNEFYISKSELRTAFQKGAQYKVFFVTNVMDNHLARIYDLNNPFKNMVDSKSLFDATGFTAELETAKISFMISGSTSKSS